MARTLPRGSGYQSGFREVFVREHGVSVKKQVIISEFFISVVVGMFVYFFILQS